MAFILRFVQRYPVADRESFMALEAEFAAMERRRSDWPKGRRYQPYAGREPTHTFIWEREFPTLAEAQEALQRIGSDPEHEELFRRQAPYITRAHTEIFETLEFER
jgi:hypothetical protein